MSWVGFVVLIIACALHWDICYSAYYIPNYSDSPRRGHGGYDDSQSQYPPVRSHRYSSSDNRRGYDSHDSYTSTPSHSRNHGRNRYNTRPIASSSYIVRRPRPDYDTTSRNPHRYDSGRYDNYRSRPNGYSSSPRRSNSYLDQYERSRQGHSYTSGPQTYHQSSSSFQRNHHRGTPHYNSKYPSNSRRHSQNSPNYRSSGTPDYRQPSSSGSRTKVHWYRPIKDYRDEYKRRNKQGYYQASYDLGKDDYYRYNYPKIPEFDYSYSHDTSSYYNYRNSKIACYQCNYRPGKTTWKVINVKKSVPDPYYPFRYMSVNTKQYVRKNSVSGGWDKCQGALTASSSQLFGIYQEATCEGSCYVRVDKNQMVYRGCYAGEWGVNPHMYGCSYQAGSLYCFCRGDRCNGFMAPNTYSDPYPSGYGERQEYPYPSDYPRSSRYTPYPGLSHYHRSHENSFPLSVHGRGHRSRYRRSARVGTLEEDEILAADINSSTMKLYAKLTGSNVSDATRVSGHSNEISVRRSCYTCGDGNCNKHFTPSEADNRGVSKDSDCYGNCFVRLDSNKRVSRGCYSGAMGINQHLIGCHVQEGATYCFCHHTNCNNFSVTMVTLGSQATSGQIQQAVKVVNKATRKTDNKEVLSTKGKVIEKYSMVLYHVEFPSDD